MKVELIRITNDPIDAIAHAGANCYNSEPNKKIVDKCKQSGHTSIMEFATFHFHIEEVSRALLAQLTRHRVGSFGVRSQRYVNEGQFNYIKPESIGNKKFTIWELQNEDNESTVISFDEMMDTINYFYQALIDAGIPKEDARFVLPNACETKIEWKINLRSLMNFMGLRLCSRAQWEIRELAQKTKNCIIEVEPDLEKYLVPKCEINYPYCFCTEEKSCGKHPTLKEIFKNI